MASEHEGACPGCTGAYDCPAPAHQHGCFADLMGYCNEPDDHAGTAKSPERPIPTLGTVGQVLQTLKDLGVTRGAALYVVDRIWWEEER